LIKVSTITEKEEARLRKVAKATGKTFGELKKLFTELRATTTSDRLAVNQVVNQLRRERTPRRNNFVGKRKPEAIEGIIIGDSGIWDKIEQIRKKAKAFIKKYGRQAAEDEQLINSNNQILDTREKIYGRDNPKYLEPLPEDLAVLERTLFGVFTKKGENKYKFATLKTTNNTLAKAWTNVKFFTPCTTNALVTEEAGEYQMSSSNAKETRTVFRASKKPWETGVIEKLLEELLDYTDINKVEEHFKTFKDAWDRKIALRGMVTWINRDRPTPWGAVWAGLADTDLGYDTDYQVRLLIPAQVPTSFGEGSEVIVLGRTRRTKTRDQDSGKLVPGDVIVDVRGIYPLPGLTTETTSSKEYTSDEEIEGWFD